MDLPDALAVELKAYKPAQRTESVSVRRRWIATRAQGIGSVKNIQAHLRHSRADTTANEHMQELPESVQRTVGSV